jgi:hypothetical protein
MREISAGSTGLVRLVAPSVARRFAISARRTSNARRLKVAGFGPAARGRVPSSPRLPSGIRPLSKNGKRGARAVPSEMVCEWREPAHHAFDARKAKSLALRPLRGPHLTYLAFDRSRRASSRRISAPSGFSAPFEALCAPQDAGLFPALTCPTGSDTRQGEVIAALPTPGAHRFPRGRYGGLCVRFGAGG